MMKKLLLAIAVLIFASAAAIAQTTPAAKSDAPSSSETKKQAVFRPTKEQIKQVQTMLKDKKLYTGEASGTYNDDTRKGISGFQKDNGLKQTGTLNRATLEKFGVELTAAQKLIPVSPNSFATAEPAKPKTPKNTAASSVASSTTPGMAAATPATEDKAKKGPPFRATADQIKAAQKLLKEKNHYTGEETGKLDDPTRDGLKKFQETAGIKVTGTLNPLTLEKMGIELTDKQKADAAASSKN